MDNNGIKIEELAFYVDSSTHTINNWYAWKRQHPTHDLAYLLPDPVYIQKGGRRIRYWNRADIGKILEFKNSLPHGRLGILGDITQKHSRRNKNVKASINNKRESE